MAYFRVTDTLAKHEVACHLIHINLYYCSIAYSGCTGRQDLKSYLMITERGSAAGFSADAGAARRGG